MDYDPAVHHRRTIRLPGYDYSGAGGYFVTICVQGRECLFGSVHDGEMQLNEAGQMVKQVWNGLNSRFSTLALDTCVVMPNHLHGIILLTDCRAELHVRPDDDVRRGESCIRPEPAHKYQGDHQDRPYGTTKDSLGRVIQGFKSLTTNAYIRGVSGNGWPPFPGRLWQRNYFEQIIRNEAELSAIREYIAANPANWAEDHENVP